MAKDPICGMEVSESSPLKFKKHGITYYFCSQHCLKKFAEESNIAEEEFLNICRVAPRTRLYKNKAIIVSAVLLCLCGLSYAFSILVPFRNALFMYFKVIWWAIILGLALGGVIDRFVPKKYVSHILSRPHKKTILYAVILGFFMSACSHGILALSMELHKKGASNPAVIAFLLASPWANITVTIMLIAFFGLIKAFYIIIAAIVVAVTTGLIYQVLEKNGLIENNENTLQLQGDFSIVQDFKKRFSSYRFSMERFKEDIKGVYGGAASLANMVLWWILIGMALASFSSAYVPPNIFHRFMGPTALGMVVTLFVATIIEVCSEGTSPLAFEIYRQTAALGNAYVFLMGGVVTDYTEIGLLYFNVGKKVAIWLPIVALPQVVLFGVLANIIF